MLEHMEVTSDEALMLAFQQGSRAAFEEIYARYRQPLFGFFRRRMADKERAEDLAQETFLAVIRATSRYEARSLVKTYLYGIALNLLANERRRQIREARTQAPEGQHDGDGSPDLESLAGPSTDGAPETVLWVRQALETLETKDREVLMLREYEQLSYTDIAQLLRVPLNTVRTRLFRARMALKEVLEPKADSESKEAMNDGKPSTAGKDSAMKTKPGIALISATGRGTNPGPTGNEA